MNIFFDIDKNMVPFGSEIKTGLEIKKQAEKHHLNVSVNYVGNRIAGNRIVE